MELKTIPPVRPNLIGRMFMTEKMEQCYHNATNDWVSSKKQALKFHESIDKLYHQQFSKNKSTYNHNIINLLYSSDK